MKFIPPMHLKDGYKVGHPFQYPADTTLVNSNWTPRTSRIPSVDKVLVFGPQYFVKEYLQDQWGRNFFDKPRQQVVDKYNRRIKNYLGAAVPIDHVEALHKVGYLPLRLKALREGTLCPLRVPVLTVQNTQDHAYWLTNMIETLMSNVLWLPMTSATTAYGYRKRFMRAAQLTGVPSEFTKWQGHDFSMRGLPGLEAACMSGAAHLLSFYGTDTIPAIDWLEEYYGADSDKELVGGSVPATEHSVMSVAGKQDELETFRRLITEVYPTGIVSIVSDTWDFWKVLTEYLPQLRDTILARDGKVVIRPDSGDPVKIICGDPDAAEGSPERKGAIRVLYEIFGGPLSSTGFQHLDPHIGLIYGDSITPDRQTEILSGLMSKGFTSDVTVLGIGSFTYQYVTRDTYGFAMKATYAERTSVGGVDIWKDPKTDNGMKKSATGRLSVTLDEYGKLVLLEKCSAVEERAGLLQTIFEDGLEHNVTTLAEIREQVEANLLKEV